MSDKNVVTEDYGFFNILEDLNYPSSDDEEIKQKVVVQTLQSGTPAQKMTIIQHFFKTMERLNLSQV